MNDIEALSERSSSIFRLVSTVNTLSRPAGYEDATIQTCKDLLLIALSMLASFIVLVL